MANKRRHILPSAAWVDGGNIQIPLKDLPPLARIKAFVFRLEVVFTLGGAAAAVAGSQLHRLISMIDLGDGRRASGPYWHFLEWMLRGAETYLPANLPASNGETHRRFITWTVPFEDPRAWAPADGEPSGADFAERVISIDTASMASLDGGTNTWNTVASLAGTLRAEAILDTPNDSPGGFLEFRHADLTGQAPTLEPGLYTDLWVYRENVGTISSAQIATAAIQADGMSVNDGLSLVDYVREFNNALSRGQDQRTDHATAPVSGEFLPEAPAYTNGAAATVTVPFLPLVFGAPAHKLTKALRVENALRLDFTGTDVTFRVGYRRFRRRSGTEAVQAFHRIGRYDVRSPADVAAKTESKKGLTSSKAAVAGYLPLRATRSR